MLDTKGLLGIAFFEATAFVILLVLLFLLHRDHRSSYFRLWIAGWFCFTFSAICEVALLVRPLPGLNIGLLLGQVAALILFLASVVESTAGSSERGWPIFSLLGVVLAVVYYIERGGPQRVTTLHWGTTILESGVCLATGWLMWRASRLRRGHGAQLLAGVFMLSGLHGLDRPVWMESPFYLLRVAFDHLLGVALGIAMVVMVLEGARNRTEELNDKMRRLTLLTTASTQTFSVQEVLDQVLKHLVESLGASHGLVRLLEGQGKSARLVIRASAGFDAAYLKKYAVLSASEPWAQQVLKEDCKFVRFDQEQDQATRQRMAENGMKEMITLALPGKDGPQGVVAVGSARSVRFQADELTYLVNIANLLGLTMQNVRLFEQVSSVQRQWEYTFDSIGDPVLVHDKQGRVLRANQRLSHLLGKEWGALIGRSINELLPRKNANYADCPYCESVAGEGDTRDPWLPGYFLASNSTFADPSGQELGTVHVLKDITDRKRAEEKYQTLISSVQEGVFISTPHGRFLDFNEALLRMTGYDTREELMSVDIPTALFANQSDRERLRKLLQDHGSVADFEFDMRRKDGEIRTMMESSIAVRDASGNVTAYQGFLLDITERTRAEYEIRRRNRELLVLNSIAQTLTESMDLTDSLQRTLRQIAELFSLDATSLYLFDGGGTTLRRVAAVGHRSEYSREFPPVAVQPELLEHIKAVHATFLAAQGLPLPAIFREAQRKEGLLAAYIVILWSKDRVIGGLVVGSRTPREFSPADVNLLIAVGSQVSSAIERTLLYEEARQAYENLRRTQEQLLHSEKMAAVGQLISGVAHELNNPLTAILGYSQLLTSSGQMGPQGMEYADKLYKQAQRTHRIVQNLLSFARQHKPERSAVRVNQALEETLALRDYDLRMSNIRVHLDLFDALPVISADPHQLQQVFLNLINNAVDAILERSKEGDIWVSTGVKDERLFAEFTDSGPGVQDASRVFDPFYTTKPVGKGTGLGLSICYGIITEHGGTIRVRNVAGRGACFTIELPMRAEVQATPALKLPAPASETRVLLIGQDESAFEAATVVLAERGYTVERVGGHPKAQTFLQDHEVDLVVVDLETISEGQDTDLVSWILEKKPGLRGRIVGLRSAKPINGHAAAPARVGMPVLQKPLKADELVAALDELMLGRVEAGALKR